ncbi:MAG TPA: CPBP family intramembrane glutamic endopeptidase [Desulfobacterales bacterium]
MTIMIGLAIHLMTNDHARLFHILIAMVVIIPLFSASVYAYCYKKHTELLLYSVICSALFGFWWFSVFRIIGYTIWPLAKPADLPHYFFLLYSHVVFAISVLAPVLLIWSIIRPKHLSLGFNLNFLQYPVSLGIRIALPLILSAIWTIALFVVLTQPTSIPGSIYTLFLVSLAKAFLTGFPEETIFRGVLQQSAIARYGTAGGILFQGIVYMLFHLHVGGVFEQKSVFLLSIFLLGILFGIVSHITRSIGWSCLVHSGIDWIIEWKNLL